MKKALGKSAKINEDIEIIEILEQDASRLLIAKLDGSGLKIKYPYRTYFEIEIEREGNIALELKSESDSIIYDGLTGDVLRGLSKEVFSGTKLQTGSSLEVSAWTLEEKENVPHTLVEFFVDGTNAYKRPILITGSDIKPTVYIDTQRNGAKFVVNTEEGKIAKFIRLTFNFSDIFCICITKLFSLKYKVIKFKDPVLLRRRNA